MIGKQEVYYAKDAIRQFGKELGTIPNASERTQSSLRKFGAVSSIIQNSYFAIENLTEQMDGYIQKANSAAETQTKLTTVMRQRMGATDKDIQSVNNLIKAQTQLGVIGGTVQRSGMQQLATFANHKQTLETLLPAMNNLLVQQKGLNATSDDAVSVANLMGKVLSDEPLLSHSATSLCELHSLTECRIIRFLV